MNVRVRCVAHIILVLTLLCLLQNVVVVTQPVTGTPRETVAPPTQNYMALTLIMIVICMLCFNFPAFICLFPAFIFAGKVSGCMPGQVHRLSIYFPYFIPSSPTAHVDLECLQVLLKM